MFKVTRIRRIVLFLLIGLFILQFLKVKVLVGGMSGSTVLFYVKLLDVFAYLESLVASKVFTTNALIAVIPIVLLYLVFGRAFCGWACPMDFIFGLLNRIVTWSDKKAVLSKKTGYTVAGAFLVLSGIVGIPVFTNYLSHITNFFRAITSGISVATGLPVNAEVLYFSGAMLVILMVLELIYPRLWCRVLCPVGKTYGLFNKVSLLRLRFVEGDCGECSLCEDVCPMGVRITPYLDETSLRDTNCIYCGECAEGCQTKGKLIDLAFTSSKEKEN